MQYAYATIHQIGTRTRRSIARGRTGPQLEEQGALARPGFAPLGQGGEHQGHLLIHRTQRGEHLAGPGDRWEDRRFEGLADGSAPGNPPRVTEEAKEFLKERLSQQRTWNAPQLAEALLGRFGISVSAEAIRQHLIAMGYSWKRTR